MNQELNNLKAKAYDLISSIEHLQRELLQTNQQITNLIEKINQDHDGGNSDNDN